MCGCSLSKKCEYCNSTDFVGYNIQSSIDPKLNSSPNTNNLQCSQNTEYVDVSRKMMHSIFQDLNLEQ